MIGMYFGLYFFYLLLQNCQLDRLIILVGPSLQIRSKDPSNLYNVLHQLPLLRGSPLMCCHVYPSGIPWGLCCVLLFYPHADNSCSTPIVDIWTWVGYWDPWNIILQLDVDPWPICYYIQIHLVLFLNGLLPRSYKGYFWFPALCKNQVLLLWEFFFQLSTAVFIDNRTFAMV